MTGRDVGQLVLGHTRLLELVDEVLVATYRHTECFILGILGWLLWTHCASSKERPDYLPRASIRVTVIPS